MASSRFLKSVEDFMRGYRYNRRTILLLVGLPGRAASN